MPKAGKNTVGNAKSGNIRKHKYEQMMENPNNFFLPISQNVGNPPEFFPCIEEN